MSVCCALSLTLCIGLARIMHVLGRCCCRRKPGRLEGPPGRSGGPFRVVPPGVRARAAGAVANETRTRYIRPVSGWALSHIEGGPVASLYPAGLACAGSGLPVRPALELALAGLAHAAAVWLSHNRDGKRERTQRRAWGFVSLAVRPRCFAEAAPPPAQLEPVRSFCAVGALVLGRLVEPERWLRARDGAGALVLGCFAVLAHRRLAAPHWFRARDGAGALTAGTELWLTSAALVLAHLAATACRLTARDGAGALLLGPLAALAHGEAVAMLAGRPGPLYCLDFKNLNDLKEVADARCTRLGSPARARVYRFVRCSSSRWRALLMPLRSGSTTAAARSARGSQQ